MPLATSARGVWPRGRRSTVETERALVAAWQHQVTEQVWLRRFVWPVSGVPAGKPVSQSADGRHSRAVTLACFNCEEARAHEDFPVKNEYRLFLHILGSSMYSTFAMRGPAERVCREGSSGFGLRL